MADKSTYFRDAILNLMKAAGITAITPYVSLHTADPGTTGASEVTGDAYVRKAVTWGAIGDGATGRKVANSAAVEWTSLDSTNDRTITYAGIRDAEAAGNFIYRIVLTGPKVVNAGDPCSFPIGDLEVEEA
jgi:hypothetical protein